MIRAMHPRARLLARTIAALIGLLFIVSGLIGVYLLLRAIWTGFASLESGTASAVAAAAGAVLLAMVNVVAQRYLDRRREIEAQQRIKKTDVYQRCMEFWLARLRDEGSRKGDRITFTDLGSADSQLMEISRELVLWGSDSVLMACAGFRRTVGPGASRYATPTF